MIGIYRNYNSFAFCIVFVLLSVNDVSGQTEANETGILSDLWSSLTSVGKAPTCPGECVHAITSIFCDNVLEEVTCGANFLRCCVPHEFSVGTPVETSAPFENFSSSQPNEHILSQPMTTTTTTSTTTTTTTTTTPKPTEAHSVTSHPLVIRPHNPKPYTPGLVFGSLNINKLNPTTNPTTIPSPTTSTTTATTATIPSTSARPVPISSESALESVGSEISQSSVVPIEEPCPGVCIKLRYVRYCGNVLSDGKCVNVGDQCCLQSEVDFDNTSNVVTLVQQSDSFNGSKEQSKDQWTEKPLIEEVLANVNQTKDGHSGPTTPMPLCEGTCVAPLFSLLCDETDYSLYCPNGGSCCVNKDPTTEAPPMKPCPGSCIPTILSGMCNRPSELILKTLDCTSGSICCHNPHQSSEETIKDVNNEESVYPQKASPALQPPIVAQNNPQYYNPILFSHENPLPPLYGSEHQIPRPQNHLPLPLIPSLNPTAVQKPPLPQQLVPKPDLSPQPPPLPESAQEDDVMSDNPPNDKSIVTKAPGGPPFCPGPCIAPMFRFTCFGGNAIYPKFQCAKGGQICCAPMTDIQAFEANVLANNGVWISPNLNKTVNYDDSPIQPPPPNKRPNPYMCGIKGTQRKETPRVVGGSDSFPGEFCWQIALINSQNQYLCGGALIGAQWVLTAAHCITTLVRNGETIYVRVGDYDLTSQVGSRGAQTQRVSTTYIHHNHNGQTLDNDIALLKLQSPVEINEAVCLVCLPARGSKRKPGKRCTVTGYGYKDETGPIALRVREADVPIVDDQECTVRINSVTEKLFILPASSFCAGGDEGNDACQGDGGSGLTCEIDGYYELTGLVSWGFGCGRSGVPGVYVKVSAFVGWINQIISVNNQ